jgi:hypothetical protein
MLLARMDGSARPTSPARPARCVSRASRPPARATSSGVRATPGSSSISSPADQQNRRRRPRRHRSPQTTLHEESDRPSTVADPLDYRRAVSSFCTTVRTGFSSCAISDLAAQRSRRRSGVVRPRRVNSRRRSIELVRWVGIHSPFRHSLAGIKLDVSIGCPPELLSKPDDAVQPASRPAQRWRRSPCACRRRTTAGAESSDHSGVGSAADVGRRAAPAWRCRTSQVHPPARRRARAPRSATTSSGSSRASTSPCGTGCAHSARRGGRRNLA